jgi:hypothetical protein
MDQKRSGHRVRTGLAKRILSLWNDEAAYSLRGCCSSFDDIRTAWALKIVAHFLEHGEDKFLDEAGKAVYKLCPYLWDVGYAGAEGKRAAVKEKDRQREEALRKKHSERFDD